LSSSCHRHVIISVNSPSIAGTGRVGPRQRSRITYSSHSDVETVSPDIDTSRPKSYEDKTKGIYHDKLQKSNSRKSQPPPKKKDFGSKSPYFRKKDIRREDTNESLQEHHEMESQQEPKELQKFYQAKPQKLENITKPLLEDKINKEENNIVFVDESNVKNTEDKNNHNDDTNSCVNDVKGNEVCLNQESKHILQNSDLFVSNTETEIVTYEANEQLENKTKESQIVQMGTAAASEIKKIDSIISSAKNTEDNNENEIKSAENSLYDISNSNNDVTEDKKQDPPMEETEISVNNNCDSKQTKDIVEQDNNIKYKRDFPEEKDAEKIVILSSTVIGSIAKENNELSSNDSLREKNDSFTEMHSATADEQINIGDQQDTIKSANKTQECTSNDNKKENSAANGIDNTVDNIVDKTEFPKENV